ncbi:unnamed protein product [Parnassius mnemosyne]|uniref:F-box domain-containing protein n=1 Tax=Parnassius mnemosyne TaxID=213953 RepID=A0AAV1LN13_9NEOP
MSLEEIIEQMNLINAFILENMTFEEKSEDNEEFINHLQTMKDWFSRISYVNKKLYLLVLLEDVQYAGTLSLLLKSLWNCRLKDSVLSISGVVTLSSYDQVPMDHNRTAAPVSILRQIMAIDRQWFHSLQSENQAIVLIELLTIAGGPVLWEVLKRAQNIYNRYREYELQNLKESVIVAKNLTNKGKTSNHNLKKDLSRRKSGDSGQAMLKPVPQMSQAQKQLEESLAVWNSTIKSIRDNLKIEEVEVILNDGTTKKIWKVDRQKPETMETVDFLQLLPSAIGKRVLSYLPSTQLNECCRVNKYWAYIIDELRAEVIARQKIDTELENLREIMAHNDESTVSLVQSYTQIEYYSSQPPSMPSVKTRHDMPSIRVSQKSGRSTFRHREKMNKPRYKTSIPIRNMAELNARLERRGAADENIWKWCENVLKLYKRPNREENDTGMKGKQSTGHLCFPCPLMEQSIIIPLSKLLVKDPTNVKVPMKSTNVNIKLRNDINTLHQQDNKRYSLWSKDLSSLYPVSKIASYQSPL